MYVVVKILVSGLIIGFVTEIARRFPTYGGLLATLFLFAQYFETYSYYS